MLGAGLENVARAKAPQGYGARKFCRDEGSGGGGASKLNPAKAPLGAGQPGPAAPVNFGWGHILLLKWRNNHFVFQTYVSISRCEQSKN